MKLLLFRFMDKRMKEEKIIQIEIDSALDEADRYAAEHTEPRHFNY